MHAHELGILRDCRYSYARDARLRMYDSIRSLRRRNSKRRNFGCECWKWRPCHLAGRAVRRAGSCPYADCVHRYASLWPPRISRPAGRAPTPPHHAQRTLQGRSDNIGFAECGRTEASRSPARNSANSPRSDTRSSPFLTKSAGGPGPRIRAVRRARVSSPRAGRAACARRCSTWAPPSKVHVPSWCPRSMERYPGRGPPDDAVQDRSQCRSVDLEIQPARRNPFRGKPIDQLVRLSILWHRAKQHPRTSVTPAAVVTISRSTAGPTCSV